MKDLTVGFIGFGLIGGSIARAIKEKNKECTLIAYNYYKGKDNPNLNDALLDGILDHISTDLSDYFPECDVIFLSAPVLSNIKYLESLKSIIKSDCIITDVGSVKGNIHSAVEKLNLESHFIGGHPMAGSEKTGYSNSNNELLKDSYYVLTTTDLTPKSMLTTMTNLVSDIGAIPIILDANEHDDITAAISHLPHIIASLLVNMVRCTDNKKEQMHKLAAGGFKDITRIASSSPIMWKDICLTNTNSISKFLQIYIDKLEEFKLSLDSKNEIYLYDNFSLAKDYRNSMYKNDTCNRKDNIMTSKKSISLKGSITIPGDKSISHRAIMLGSLANGTTRISHFLEGADCLSTIKCFNQMGIVIDRNGEDVIIHGNGLHGLKAPNDILNVGNSGTTMRLISGILAAQNFDVTLTGDSSIQKRPMKRIIEPLSLMGSNISSINNNDCAPLCIHGSTLNGIVYNSPVASAQVKSSILLAGLYANEPTTVIEPYTSRNHTELMFNAFSVKSLVDNTAVTVYPTKELLAQDIKIPGDISSAAYFIVAGLIVPNSVIKLINVGINSTRDGIIKVCRSMGANIVLENECISNGELTADIIIKHSELKGITIEGSIIPTLIDEIPVIAILACFAKGKTIIKDAAELKVKESNRIDIMSNNLHKMGADITPTDDGLIINGGKALHGATIDSHSDHRIAMSFAIAALMAEGETIIKDHDCVNISYPNFYKDLNELIKY